jgi:ParB family chromosome partitioning protein
VQGLAQMFRSVEKEEGKRQQKSTLYTEHVLPYLEERPTDSVLDFGCGKGAYIAALRDGGRRAMGLEFYNNNGFQIDVGRGNAMIDNLIKHIRHGGLFDVVVCDSVLNSVDSVEAEVSVLRCCNAFSKGTVFVSGRPLSDLMTKMKLRRRLDKSALVGNLSAFLDANNFTATYRRGNWYYQHYHTPETLEAACEKAGLGIERVHFGCNSFQAQCVKKHELTKEEIQEAVTFEFTLPLPNGKRYDRAADVLSVLAFDP